MHATPQFFLDFFGAREDQKTDRYFGTTNSDGSVTLSQYLPPIESLGNFAWL
jgi:hypothetical protein